MTAAKTDPIADAPKADAPAVSVSDTPEFKAALEEARNSLLASNKATIEELRTGILTEVAKVNVAQANGEDPKQLISDLVVALIGATDHGGNRKPIAPAEAQRRIVAHGKMIEVAKRIHADTSLKPHYMVVAEIQLEEQLIQKFTPAGEGKWKQTQIIWRGLPSSGLRPVNDIAKEIFAYYLESIGGSTANQAGVRDQPTWVSYGGLQIVGNPPQSVSNRGNSFEPTEPMELGKDLNKPTDVITSTDDPAAKLIPVLGKTFAPAQRTAAGDTPSLQFPSS